MENRDDQDVVAGKEVECYGNKAPEAHVWWDQDKHIEKRKIEIQVVVV